MQAGFRKIGEVTIHQGRIIELARARFVSPDGQAFEREVVHHPGAVSVVPLLGDGNVVLVRQYRAALDAELLEIPAGLRDVDGEDPIETARRELAEEAGYEARSLELLAWFHNSAGFSDEMCEIYLGTDLVDAPTDLQGLEEQHMTVEVVALADTADMIAAGEITDAKTIIGLLLALRRLER